MALRFLLAYSAPALIGAGLLACGNAADDDDTSSGGAGPSTTVSASTSGAGAMTTSTASSGSGAGPITCTGEYSTLPDGPCDLLEQGCPLGQSCEPKNSGGAYTPTCVDNPGLKGANKFCQSSNECQAGLFCVFNLCTPVCCPTTNEPCGGGTCNVEFSGDTGNWAPGFITLCSFLEKCQVLTADACPEGKDCHLQDFEQGLAVCVPPNGSFVPEGGACSYLNDCADMQLCYNNACRFNCYVSASGQGMPGLGGCPEGQDCVADEFGVDDIGICQP
jgi:hypothetical protein